MPGKFIALEGTSGTLLAAAAQAITRRVRAAGLAAVLTREPSDGPIGGQLRQVLTGRTLVHPLAHPLLALGDRIDHLYREGDGILTHLAAGKWVLCTHYLLAAYSAFDDVTSLDRLKRINAPCRWPDLVIFINSEDAPERERYRRAIERVQRDGSIVAVIEGDADIEEACAALVTPLLTEAKR